MYRIVHHRFMAEMKHNLDFDECKLISAGLSCYTSGKMGK
jgi:hypothetical protein